MSQNPSVKIKVGEKQKCGFQKKKRGEHQQKGLR